MINYNNMVFLENFKYKPYEFNAELKEGVFAFDIETYGNKEICITYATMLMDVADNENKCLHNSNKSDLIYNLENLPYLRTIVYAHNGGRFDYKCIIDELIKRGYKVTQKELEEIEINNNVYFKEKKSRKAYEPKSITILYKNNIIYSMKVCVADYPTYYIRGKKKGEIKKHNYKMIEFKDSMLMLAGSLKSVVKSYLGVSMSKDGLDYYKVRYEGYKLNESEKRYCYEDVFYLKELLKYEFIEAQEFRDSDGRLISSLSKKDKLTSASYGFTVLKDFIYYDCITTDNYLKNYSNKELKQRITDYRNFPQYHDNNGRLCNEVIQKSNKYNKEIIFRIIFPLLPLNIDNFVRQSYEGGLCLSRQPIDKHFNHKHNIRFAGNGASLDSNSMYPDKMKNRILPWGHAMKVNVANIDNNFICNNLCILKIITKGEVSLKQDKFPTRRAGGTENAMFSKKDIFTSNKIKGIYYNLSLTLNSVDFIDFIDSYDIDFYKIEECIMFKSTRGIFDTFIDYFYDIKCNSKGSRKQNAKLILNATYGKFGTKKIESDYEPLFEDGIFKYTKADRLIVSSSIYVPIASFITGYARNDLKTTCEKIGVKYFLYGDTDSLHLSCNKEYIENKCADILDKTKLGMWDMESIISDGIYLGAKRYAEKVGVDNKGEATNNIKDIVNYEWNVKCCGIPVDDQNTVANNIELFQYAELNKKDFEKLLKNNLITIDSKTNLYQYNGRYLKGIFPVNKSKAVKGGISIIPMPYMITEKNIY